jgi:hypothetical protein
MAVETAKFYQPLAKAEQKLEFVRKIDEYASNHHLTRMPGNLTSFGVLVHAPYDDVCMYLYSSCATTTTR